MYSEDSHIRVRGAAGTNLQVADCPEQYGSVRENCVAGSLLLHITEESRVFLDNIWVWYGVMFFSLLTLVRFDTDWYPGT